MWQSSSSAALSLGALSWLGRLTGDFRYEGDNVKVYAPIASMLLISVVLSVALAVVFLKLPPVRSAFAGSWRANSTGSAGSTPR